MNDLLTQVSISILPTVLDAALKVTLLLAIAGLCCSMMRRQSAAARHAVWSFAVVAALSIPAMEAMLPSWRAGIFAMPAVAQSIPVEATASAPVVPTALGSHDEGRERSSVVPQASIVEEDRSLTNSAAPTPSAEFKRSFQMPSVTLSQMLLAIWMLGFMIALAPLAISIVRVKAFARRAKRGLSPRWKQTLRDLPSSARPKRAVTYLESSQTSMPLACGIFSPIVIVPGDAERWPAWKRRNILVHELAHVQRFDCLTQALATLLCSIYWFNPLAWVAASRMRFERELACDDRVLESGSQPVDYADQLLEVARSLRPAAGTGMAAIAMARPSNLSTRLVAVLDTTRSRRAISGRATGLFAAASLLLLLPLAAFKPWKSETPLTEKQRAVEAEAPRSAELGTPPESNLTSSEISLAAGPAITNVSPGLISGTELNPLAAVPAVLSPIAAQTDGLVCQSTDGNGSTSIHEDDGSFRLTLKHSSDGCTLEITADGKFTFADDLSDIATISQGGSLIIKETNGPVVRRLDMRNVGGIVQRRFSLNGVASPFGEDERRWLAQLLLAVERRTAFAAKTRVPQLWENAGVKGVLNEVSAMSSSYPKRVYIETLLDIGMNFDGPTLTKIIRQVGSEFSSDYERRVILARMPVQKFMDEGAWNALADAIAKMSSDYEKRVILTTAFDGRGVNASSAARLLNAASAIKSSYELRVILTGPAMVFASNPASRPAYVAALRRITSDYERRTVLTALSGQLASDPMAMAEVLGSATSMESDYEKSEVIRAFTRRGLNKNSLETLVAITGGINSDYEKHRALSAILSSSPKLDARGLNDVLIVAATVKSDYELAGFLKEMIAKVPWNAIPRDAFEKALASISSDTEENSVRAAIQRTETR